MAYCLTEDVQELNQGRSEFSATSQPTASQVSDFIDQTAAEIDGILRSQGYSLPISVTASSTLKLLEGYNAQGAACLVEQGARSTKPTKADGTSACAMWAAAKKMLRSGALELDAAKDTAESFPRFGGNASPIFSLDQQF